MTTVEYDEFVQAKVDLHRSFGFHVAADAVNPILKPHQRDIVLWAIAGGRRAVFARFGLGKTFLQLEIARLILEQASDLTHRRALIVLPLGVRPDFFRDAATLGVPVRFVRTSAEVLELDAPGIYLTNYESVREGKLDPALFDVASLDEAAVLRDFGSKTYQEFGPLFAGVPYRFVATATPSPNRYKELIHYAGFLGVMDTGQALTRFFQRNSEKAGDLTLYPHKEREFWLWLNTWAVFLQRPSDLGYSDEGYELPALDVRWHEVDVDLADDTVGRDGQGALFRNAALGVMQAAREKRTSIDVRVATAAQIVAEAPDDHFLLWHDLEDERAALEDAMPANSYGLWQEFRDGNSRALALYERHYSARQYADGRERRLFMGPGEKQVLLTRDGTALFGWRRFVDDSGQQGINCSVFRNEGGTQSSDLIREAMAIAWRRWPGQRLYTYVDPAAVASTNPGYCFIAAGWRAAGYTKGGLRILEALPGTPVPNVAATRDLVSVFGSLDLDERERRVVDFADGRLRLLATKPSLSGAGCNFQRHCHRAVFTGIGFSFERFIQAVHRIQRYGQDHPVRIDVIYTATERDVVRALQAKWVQHEELTDRMSQIIREHGLSRDSIAAELRRSIGVQRLEAAGEGWLVANNDCIPETRSMETNSVDLIVTSIPFANHYEYTPAAEDFGHTDDNGHFWAQMDYLTPELLRVLRPGRIYACHVKDRILFGAVTGAGVPTVSPFHAEAIFHAQKHGFDYLGMITVVTDVVRENNQTYRLGWSEMAKDGTKMGVGSPEYVLLFHKPQSDRSKGYADVPVTKSKQAYTRARWQVDAHAYWRSSGNRYLTPDELAALPPEDAGRLFTEQTLRQVYDYESHVRIGEDLDGRGALPATFMTLAPGSWSDEVWHDVQRMLTLNTEQSRRAQAMHVCPLQFDIVDRLIARYSNPGDLVFDPFGGLFTVPVRALRAGRRGRAVELNPGYFADGVKYLQAEERRHDMPGLFELEALEATG